LNIPHDCDLEIKQNGNEILIGPFIGLLPGYYQSSIEKRLDSLREYLFHYREIKGVIIVFSLEHVDKSNQTVKGFLFNPKTKQWQEGTYPYPSSIFLMTKSISSPWIKHFQSIIGDTVFNDFHYNRWTIHKRLAASLGTKFYLPDSMLYGGPQDLYYFLKKFPNVKVKSLNTVNNTPINVLLRDSSTIEISNPKKNERDRYKCYNRDQAYSVFSTYFKAGEYLIQESIDVPGYKTLEFRIILVKNQSGQWQSMGMFARDKESSVSSGNRFPIVKLEKARLKEHLNRSGLYSSMVYQELIYIAIDAVQAVEGTGVHFANAAVDMTIGELGDIWILDVDHSNPHHDIALIAGDPELFYEILKMNILYAKKLAGF
jgi:hypothetical protein